MPSFFKASHRLLQQTRRFSSKPVSPVNEEFPKTVLVAFGFSLGLVATVGAFRLMDKTNPNKIALHKSENNEQSKHQIVKPN
jgi:hypothetical protein